MRRGLLALVMVGWVAACSGNTPPPTEEPGDSTPQPDPQTQPDPPPPPPPQVISGSLKIHTRWKTGPEGSSVHVQLGDGTRFFKRPDASGDVTFEDPSLVGPQNVTLVVKDPSGFSQAFTYLALERPEVWLPLKSEDPPAQNPPRAFISGKVTGMRDTHGVYLHAVGQGVRGSSLVNADGSFRIQVEGTLPAVVDLFAIEEDTSNPFEPKRVVGLKRGIPAPAWQQVSGQDVALDHPVDQRMQLTVNGAQVYQQDFASAWLVFYQDGQYLFDTYRDTFHSPTRGIPSSVPTIALTAPFDTTRAMLLVDVGAAYELPSGSASARVPVENSSSVTLSFPKPMTLTSPTALGSWSEPAPVFSGPGGLVFRWSVDAAAQLVELSMTPDFDNSFQKFSWKVTAPGSVTSFKPFRLRLDETSYMNPSFRGAYRLSLRSQFDGAIGHYADFFTQKPASKPLAPRWWTSLEGSLDFK
ncbi:hypothetical protein [Archangium lipolyticum]|uniref:hypothetical protein n=1 Tax=Archangium lipolyticum TaxID=2970465 RepID=UPI00214A7FD2|nr:hypothetical protein [Archangium lipolyticum]